MPAEGWKRQPFDPNLGIVLRVLSVSLLPSLSTCVLLSANFVSLSFLLSPSPLTSSTVNEAEHRPLQHASIGRQSCRVTDPPVVIRGLIMSAGDKKYKALFREYLY